MKLRKILAIVLVVIMASVCFTACKGNKEDADSPTNAQETTLSEEEAIEKLSQKVIFENGEYYIPVEHLLIMNSASSTWFAVYEKSTDTWVYDPISTTTITVKNLKEQNFFRLIKEREVKKAVSSGKALVKGERTYIYTATEVPNLISKIVGKDGKQYIPYSELELILQKITEENYKR